MIDQLELMRVVEQHRGNAVVMPVFRASLAWPQVSRNPRRDIPIGTFYAIRPGPQGYLSQRDWARPGS